MNIIRHGSSPIFSSAVEYGGLVFVAGQTARDLSKDVRGQTEEVLKTIDQLLTKAGSSKSNMLSANVWLSDIRNREQMNVAWQSWVDPAQLPSRATVEAKLADARMLVEIAVIAARSA